MNPLVLHPIGIIHSPFRRAAETPIQSVMAPEAEGTIELIPEYVPALRDLDGFDRIWLLYWFDRSRSAGLVIKPFLDQSEHGVFATRSPSRPNPLGLSCVRLLAVDNHRLRVSGLDMLDQTPLLDLKPYVPAFDSFKAERIGWLTDKTMDRVLADDRFEKKVPPLPDGTR